MKQPPLRVVEVDRRSRDRREESDADREQRGQLERQLRRARDQIQRAWDQGFACAIDMLARGATLDEMRSKVRHPQAVPVLARGTRDFGTEDVTKPINLAEPGPKAVR